MHDAPILSERASAVTGRQFRYYDFVMAAFVAILLLSNIIGAAKPAALTLNGEQWIFGQALDKEQPGVSSEVMPRAKQLKKFGMPFAS